jgi:hypothetical protein
MSRPRSRSVHSSDQVQIKASASLHPSKRRTSRVSFSANKYNRKASYTRKRRLSPIEEGNEDRISSSPKSGIQITRKTSLRSIMNNKNSKTKTKKPKSIIDSIKSIFKF